MTIVDGLNTYHQAAQNERDRLVHQIRRFEQDIASMQAKLAGIEAELPDVAAAIVREGGTPVVRPRPTPQNLPATER